MDKERNELIKNIMELMEQKQTPDDEDWWSRKFDYLHEKKIESLKRIYEGLLKKND